MMIPTTSQSPINQRPHIPVMLREVLQYLNPQDDETYIDGTFGAGGYSEAILSAADCILYGIDRDPLAEHMAEPIKERFTHRFALLQGEFGHLDQLLDQAGIETIDGIVLDLGVSSMQLDDGERGFSFRFDGPLDMRMGTGPLTAATIVNEYDEQDIANILFRYGEERFSRRIARAIAEARHQQPITTTGELRNIIHKAVGRYPDRIDPATRSFQGLRIAVNGELEQLEQVLPAALERLRVGGRLVVVSFHSLEDRIVKQFIQQHSRTDAGISRHVPNVELMPQPVLKPLHRGVVSVSDGEADANPRARSAKLRAAVKQAEWQRDRRKGRWA